MRLRDVGDDRAAAGAADGGLRSQINSNLIRAGFRDVVHIRQDEIEVEMFSRFTQAVEQLRDEIGDVVYVQEEGLSVEQLRDHLTEVVITRDCRLVVDQLDLFASPGLPRAHYEQYTEVRAGKVREGEAGGMVPLCFTGRYATFSDWPEGWQRPALADDPESEQACLPRLARLQEER